MQKRENSERCGQSRVAADKRVRIRMTLACARAPVSELVPSVNKMAPRLLVLLLLAVGPAYVAASSYAELLEEDQLGLTTLEKNARAFLRYVELRAGRQLTQEEMRNAYAEKVKTYRAMESETSVTQIDAIRHWVKAVAPALSETESTTQLETHGPLHLVLKKASELLGREHDADSHPYKEAKEIIVSMRQFTEKIILYYRSRNRKEEL